MRPVLRRAIAWILSARIVNAEARLVVDANLVVKRFVTEEHSPQARRLLLSTADILAPRFLAIEAGNTFLKKVRLGEMTQEAALLALEAIPMYLHLLDTSSLHASAWNIATRYGRSFYDALYVALALEESCQLITADERLVNAVHSQLGESVIWLGTLPA